MTFVAIAIALGGVLGMAALVAGMLWWTFARQGDRTSLVKTSDAALQQVAGALGLAFVPGRSQELPTLGAVANFGTAEGPHRGFHLLVRVAWDPDVSTPVVFRTVLELAPPVGKTFASGPLGPLGRQGRLEVEPGALTFAPKTPCLAGSASYQFFVVTDAAVLGAHVDGLCDLGDALARAEVR
jgi:hypothetical protein